MRKPEVDRILDEWGDIREWGPVNTPITNENPHEEQNDVQSEFADNSDSVYSPSHYTSRGIETVEKIDLVLDGLSGPEAYYLGNILKYFDRAGLKGDAYEDLDKASNYATRLVTGHWKDCN